MNIRTKRTLIFIFFLSACGHADQVVLEDTIDPSASPIPCQDFIQAVVSFEPGAGAGFGQNAMPDVVLGPPQGEGNGQGSLHVVALGDHGKIIVNTFPCEIIDQEGVDFIVFENTFLIGGEADNPFAEVAAVSVSSDGENFVRFPCQQIRYPYTGCAGWRPIFSNPNNTISPFDADNAGGDPFDLAEIGVDRARYILIEDVSGGGLPPSVGFDLDAIAVLHGGKGD